jgi:pilus assembly protein Flp/PilA
LDVWQIFGEITLPLARTARSLSPIGSQPAAPGTQPLEGTQMNSLFLKLYLELQNLAHREEGQDLVEYALLVALIALAAIVGVNKVAAAITTVFSNISASLS